MLFKISHAKTLGGLASGTGGGAGGAGAYAIYTKATNSQPAVFTSTGERDAYFSANPDELTAITGAPYMVGIGTTAEDPDSVVDITGWYAYDAIGFPLGWQSLATILKGEKGDPGPNGNGYEDGGELLATDNPENKDTGAYRVTGTFVGAPTLTGSDYTGVMLIQNDIDSDVARQILYFNAEGLFTKAKSDAGWEANWHHFSQVDNFVLVPLTAEENELYTYDAATRRLKGTGVKAVNGSIETSAGSVDIGSHRVASINNHIGFKNLATDQVFVSPYQLISETGYTLPVHIKFTTDFQPDVVRNDVTDTPLTNPQWTITGQPEDEVLFRIELTDVTVPMTNVYFYGHTNGKESFRALLGDVALGANSFTLEMPLFIKTLESVTLSIASDDGNVQLNGNSAGVPAYKVGIRFYEEEADSVPHDSKAIEELRGGQRPADFDPSVAYSAGDTVYNPDTNLDYQAKVTTGPGEFVAGDWDAISTINNAKPVVLRERLARLPDGQKLKPNDIDFLDSVNCVYVSNVGDDNNDGRSPETPVQNIGHAAFLAQQFPETERVIIACLDASTFNDDYYAVNKIDVYMPFAFLNGNFSSEYTESRTHVIGKLFGLSGLGGSDYFDIGEMLGQVIIVEQNFESATLKIRDFEAGGVTYNGSPSGSLRYEVHHVKNGVTLPPAPPTLKIRGFFGEEEFGFSHKDSTQAVYVSSTGSDNNDGRSPQEAVATLQKAYNLAESLPSNAPRSIWCFDSSVFAENLTINAPINIEMPQATVNGDIVGYTSGVVNVHIGRVNGALSVASGDNFNIDSYEGTITVQSSTHLETSVKISHMSSGSLIYAAGLNGTIYFGIEHVPDALVVPDAPAGLTVEGFIGTKFGRKDLPDGAQCVYVSDNGDDTKDGLSIANPVKTLTRAVDILYGLPPTSKRVVICEDASVFTENFVAAESIDFYLPNATITGNVSGPQNGIFNATVGKITGLLGVGTGDNFTIGEYDGDVTIQGVAHDNSSLKINKMTGGSIVYGDGATGSLFYGIEHVHTGFTLPTAPAGLSVYGYIEDLLVPSGDGDMTKVVYDPTGVDGDAFDMDNMAEGANSKILTQAERGKIAASYSTPGEVKTAVESLSGTGRVEGGAIYGATDGISLDVPSFTPVSGNWYEIAKISDPDSNGKPFVFELTAKVYSGTEVALVKADVASEFGTHDSPSFSIDVINSVDTDGILTGIRLLKATPEPTADFSVQIQLTTTAATTGLVALGNRDNEAELTLAAMDPWTDVPGQAVGAVEYLPRYNVRVLKATIDGTNGNLLFRSPDSTYLGDVTIERVGEEPAGAWEIYPSDQPGHVFADSNTYFDVAAHSSGAPVIADKTFVIGYPTVKTYNLQGQLIDNNFSIELIWEKPIG